MLFVSSCAWLLVCVVISGTMADEKNSDHKSPASMEVETHIRDYTQGEIQEHHQRNAPLLLQAVRQEMERVWMPRFDALEDRLRELTLPHPPHGQHSEVPLDKVGTSSMHQR